MECPIGEVFFFFGGGFCDFLSEGGCIGRVGGGVVFSALLFFWVQCN